ncbi:hypothetical protein Y032_0155g3062 [Ancylostoma ceylanicum]|uniref:Uncharacterized protein n=1 Tax=Ancylostoma ceylanicum TaxID=53326 RepID=A0A016SZQ1_9BILA|nr:hypothetical protein Y032_0155g3062 [Ancylostoma ceylanicum]
MKAGRLYRHLPKFQRKSPRNKRDIRLRPSTQIHLQCPLRPFDDFVKAGQILSEMEGTLHNMGQLVGHVFLNLTCIAIDTGLEFRLQLWKNLVTSKTTNEKSKMMLLMCLRKL